MPDIQAVLAANEMVSQEVLRASGDSIDQSRRFPRENQSKKPAKCRYATTI
jgi:hypothetical protein